MKHAVPNTNVDKGVCSYDQTHVFKINGLVTPEKIRIGPAAAFRPPAPTNKLSPPMPVTGSPGLV